MLSVGKQAPSFALRDQNGRTHKLEDYLGSWLVIYFYPKDNTPGCTKEACSFRDLYDVFKDQGINVLGISKDSISSHANFTDRYSLPFPLLSDPEHKIIEKYGAWQEKTSFGNTYFGTARVTYIIDPKGKIARAYPKVNPINHAAEVKAFLDKQGLSKPTASHP